MTANVTHGAKWVGMQSLVGKSISFITQIVLAWFLIEEDFGLVALALTIYILIGTVQSAGVVEFLVSRSKRMTLWMPVSFWTSIFIGLISLVTCTSAGLLAAEIYNNPRLFHLLSVLSVGYLFRSASCVSHACLLTMMRFKAIAIVDLLLVVTRSAVSVILAKVGFGPWAIIIPIPIGYMIQMLIYVSLSPPKITGIVTLRRVKVLLNNSWLLVAAAINAALIGQVDYLIIGRYVSSTELGLYYFAFAFSAQAMQIFAFNISGVLFPAFSSLKRDPARQLNAFIKSVRVFNHIIFPICFLQAALARPIFDLLFADRWLNSVPLAQWLFIGLAFQSISWPTASLMKAQGRLKANLTAGCASVCILIIIMFCAVRFGGIYGAAIGIVIHAIIHAMLYLAIALNQDARQIKMMAKEYASAITIALISGIAAFFISEKIAGNGHGSSRWIMTTNQILTAGSAGVVTYLLLIVVFKRREFQSIFSNRK